MDQVKIGQFIAELRKEKGMTQEELGNILGVTGKAVSRWETGNGIPDISIVNDVSEALGITTTELLNGERVKSLKDKNLDEITENSIGFYKSRLKKKFKKVLIILCSVIFVLTTIILLIFYVNNYNKYQLYNIFSDTPEISLSGILSINNDKNTLVISKFKYSGEEIENIYDLDYEIISNNKSIYKYNDINNYSYNVNSILYNFSSAIKTINFYINNLNNNDINSLLNNDVAIKINYIAVDKNVYSYSFPIKIVKEYSNSNLLFLR